MTLLDVIAITHAADLFDQHTAAREATYTWSELAAQLTHHDRRPTKDRRGANSPAMLGFTLARFASGPCACGAAPRGHRRGCPDFGGAEPRGHRIDRNVLEVTALGHDLDKSELGADLDEAGRDRALARIAELGVRCVVYSSHGYAPPAKCNLRVVYSLSRPVAVADWPRFRDAAYRWIGLPTGCTPAARHFWWAPSAPDGAPVIAHAFDGAPIDVDAILARAPVTERPPREPSARIEGALTFDAIATWCPDAEIYEHGDERRAIVECPNADAHTNGRRDAMVFEQSNGMLGFKCLHGHCTKLGWREFRLHHEPGHLAPATPAEAAIVDAAVEMSYRNDSAPAVATPTAPRRLGVLISRVALADRPPLREYATGISDLDRLIGGGLTTRQLTVMMAPPGDGKSALAVSTMLQIEPLVPGLYASTELETHELEARFAAAILGCSWTDIARGRGPSRAEIGAALAGRRIVLIGSELLPRGEAALAAIHAEAIAMTADYGVPPAVFVDYLQDLARGGDQNGLHAKIGDIAMRLRAMSQALDCAILAVSSVSRTYYGIKKVAAMREANDPTVYLAAAKESGDVDYAGAVVLFLDVHEREDGVDHRVARIAVAKSRHGSTGFVGARFYGASGRWAPAPDALAIISIEARADRQNQRKEETDENLVLRAIDRYGDVAWRDLRMLVGISGSGAAQRADRAKARLLASKVIDEVPVPYEDALNRMRTRKLLRRVAPEPTATPRFIEVAS